MGIAINHGTEPPIRVQKKLNFFSRNPRIYESTIFSVINAAFTCGSRRKTMAYYTLKSIGKSSDYMTILKETDEGYVVRIVRDKDGFDDVTTDFISRSLFESCIRTGYLTKIETQEDKLAASC